MNSRKTLAALSNEERLENAIKNYDNLLELHFCSKSGVYYLTRPFSRFDEREAAEFLNGECSLFGEALKRRHLVVCHPIPVAMMEQFDIVHRNVMRHLQNNDMRKLGSTSEARVQNMETQYDNESQDYRSNKKFNDSTEMQAYGRDYYRRMVQTHAYFGGVPRLGG